MQQPQPSFDHLSTLSVGLMERYAQSGDVLVALRWVLPEILQSINAQAGSLFLLQANTQDLHCKVCVGPVDITGIKVPITSGLVGQAFRERQGLLIADAQQHASHHSVVDTQTGFVTRSILTVPIVFGDQCFGCLQAINRLNEQGDICAFEEVHLSAFQQLATMLGIALQNVDLAGQLVHDALIKKDLKSAEEAQSSLFPGLSSFPFIAGQVIPARNLSGDFVDYFTVGDHIVFCQGDVAGKGIPAALTVARCLALFRLFAKAGLPPEQIAHNINHELYELASRSEMSAGFVTFLVGCFDPNTRHVTFVNCGHGDVLLVHANQTVEHMGALLPPLGVVASDTLNFQTHGWHLPKQMARMFVFTDGILEANANGKELGLQGVTALAKAVVHLPVEQALTKIMGLFQQARLQTTDDATLMIVGE